MKLKIFLLVFLFLNISYGGLLIKPEQAIKEEFPNAEVKKKNILLNKTQKGKIQKLSKSKLSSNIVTTYIIKKDKEVLAYGIIHTHRVRTRKETVLFILNPECKILDIEIIAFYEPPEYIPSERWLKTFKDKGIDDELKLKRDIPNITGATLSAKALTNASKQVVAICEVLFKGK